MNIHIDPSMMLLAAEPQDQRQDATMSVGNLARWLHRRSGAPKAACVDLAVSAVLGALADAKTIAAQSGTAGGKP
jgi:hypothetical protein